MLIKGIYTNISCALFQACMRTSNVLCDRKFLQQKLLCSPLLSHSCKTKPLKTPQTATTKCWHLVSIIVCNVVTSAFTSKLPASYICFFLFMLCRKKGTLFHILSKYSWVNIWNTMVMRFSYQGNHKWVLEAQHCAYCQHGIETREDGTK